MKSVFSLLLLLVTLSLSAKDFKLYYLGGQSNMVGLGYNTELPLKLNREFEKVFLFHGNPVGDDDPKGGRGIWTTLKPGNGFGFASDSIVNTYSDRFGVELSFASKLIELDPNSNIAIVKYARGGSSLDYKASRHGTWYPDYNDSTGLNQYDSFLATLRNAFSVTDIDGDGDPDRLIPTGIIWMQGESDAYPNEFVAKRYLDNLTEMMGLIRAALRVDDLPVVIGRIADSGQDDDGKVMDYIDIVRNAQEHFVESDVNSAIVRTTDDYNWSDRWHYDSAGYIDLGEKFALAIHKLNYGK